MSFKGKHHSEETKKKISLAHIGKLNPNRGKGKFGIPRRLSDGSWNKEYTLKMSRLHSESYRERTRKWIKNHPEYRSKQNAIRKRGLPTWISITDQRPEGFVYHHLCPELQIAIPKELHLSLNHHAIKNPESMRMINWRAMEWIDNFNTTEFVKEFVEYSDYPIGIVKK